MKLKYIIVPIVLILALIGFLSLFGFLLPGITHSGDSQLSGITRSITNATSSVTSSTGKLVLDIDTRATYRSVQQDTAATVYCIEGATTTAAVSSGHRLVQGDKYVWSADTHNLWPGKISCLTNTTTSILLTTQFYE